MSKLVAYDWNPETGVATLDYGDHLVVRAEPTNPNHAGWANDRHDMIVRQIRIGVRMDSGTGFAYYV